MTGADTCELCEESGGELLWQGARCRVISVAEAGYVGYCRVIWTAHVKEMTDLDAADRDYLMNVVFALEAVLRDELDPLKINLASFGNAVPHLHWHVIPRFEDDPHFPQPAWGPRVRTDPPHRAGIPTAALRAKLAAALDQVKTI